MIRSTPRCRRAPLPARPTAAALALLLAAAAAAAPQDGDAPSPQIDVGPPPVVADKSAMDPEVVALLDERVAAVEATPSDPKAWEELGLAYEANTIWSLADEAYGQLLELNGNSPEWRYRRGVVRFKLGELELALEDLGAAAEAFKNTPVVQAWHADLLRMVGELEAAEAGWRQAIEAEKKQEPRIEWPQSRVGLALTLLDLEEPEEAEALCRRALELDPGYTHARFVLGRALRDLGRTQEAAAALSEGADSFPGYPPDPHQGRLDDAARGFSRRMMVIENLVGSMNLAEAKRRVAEIMEAYPENHQVIDMAARIALRENDLIRARELLQRSLSMAPEDPSTLLEACLVEITEADGYSRQIAQLQQMAQAGQAVSPEQMDNLRQRAVGPADQAVEYANRAVQAAPLVGRYPFWLGMALRTKAMLSTDQNEQGQLMQQSLAAMQRAGRLGCTEPAFHQQIANLYAMMGNGRMMYLHAREHVARNPGDPNGLSFAIQGAISVEKPEEARELTARLEQVAGELRDLGSLQFVVQAYLTVEDLDAAERALATFEEIGAGNPQVSQFVVAVQQHIATRRQEAEPAAGPPPPPPADGGQGGGDGR